MPTSRRARPPHPHGKLAGSRCAHTPPPGLSLNAGTATPDDEDAQAAYAHRERTAAWRAGAGELCAVVERRRRAYDPAVAEWRVVRRWTFEGPGEAGADIEGGRAFALAHKTTGAERQLSIEIARGGHGVSRSRAKRCSAPTSTTQTRRGASSSTARATSFAPSRTSRQHAAAIRRRGPLRPSARPSASGRTGSAIGARGRGARFVGHRGEQPLVVQARVTAKGYATAKATWAIVVK
jgi:hypothetical protein